MQSPGAADGAALEPARVWQVNHSLRELRWPAPYDVLVDDAPSKWQPIPRTAPLYVLNQSRLNLQTRTCERNLTRAGRQHERATSNMAYPAFCPASELGRVCETTPLPRPHFFACLWSSLGRQ